MSRPFRLVAGFVLALGLMTQAAAQKTPEDPKTGKEDAPKPPAGWKEHSPRDGTYLVWIPLKTSKQSERERNASIRGAKFRINVLTILTAGGPTYVVEEVLLSPNLAKQFKTSELEEMFRDSITTEVGGKVADESSVKAGTVEGKEYRIETGKTVTLARIYSTTTRVFVLRVVGTKAQVDADGSKTFLESGRLTSGAAAGTTPGVVAAAPQTSEECSTPSSRTWPPRVGCWWA